MTRGSTMGLGALGIAVALTAGSGCGDSRSGEAPGQAPDAVAAIAAPAAAQVPGAPEASPVGVAAPADPVASPTAPAPAATWQDPNPKPDEPDVRQVHGTRGGTISYSVPADLGTLHPLKSLGATDQEVRSLIYDSLYGYDHEKWDNEPGITKSYEMSPDGLVWTFRLRRGVRWSDGHPFTADDVLFTFTELFRDSFIGSEKDILQDSQKRVPRVEKVDDDTVRFTLHEVNALFLDHISNPKIMPKHKWEQAAADGKFMEILKVGDPYADMVGTGPYRIVDYKQDEVIVFERNPHYWRYDLDGTRLPYADRMVIRIVPDQNTMYVKFKNGDFDLLEPLRPEDYEDAVASAKACDFTVHRLGASLVTAYFCVNQNPGQNPETGKAYVEPWKLKYFQMVEFRRACSHAIDRQAIVDNLIQGRGEPIYDFTPPANKLWYSPDTPRYPLDRAKAKALLDQIGLKDRDGDGIRETPEGQKFSFVVNTNTENNTRKKILTMLQKDFADVGLEIIAQPITFNTLVESIRSQYTWEAFVLGWASGVPPDPLQSKSIIQSFGESHNWFPKQAAPATPWEAELDQLVQQMATTLDRTARKAINDRIQAILAEQQAMIFIYSPKMYVATRNRFTNLKCSLLRPYTYWNIFEIAVTK